MKISPPVSAALYPLSKLYGLIVIARRQLYARRWLRVRRLRSAVISVGNITVGGTGKTPMVMWLAERLRAEGKKVAILTRGYGGSEGESDEVNVLRSRLGESVTLGVGANRFRCGREIESRQPVDIFILDDGFQHLQLARDLDIVMLDGSRPLETERLLPAGVLREPVAACRRADFMIVTRKTERPVAETPGPGQVPVFYAQTRLLGFRRFGSHGAPVDFTEIGSGPFYAFCGIGNPDAFFEDLKRWRVPVVQQKAYSDHHRYSYRDTEYLQREAQRTGAPALVTTEKDAQNLPISAVRMPVWVAVIDFVFSAESELMAAIDRILRTRREAAS